MGGTDPRHGLLARLRLVRDGAMGPAEAMQPLLESSDWDDPDVSVAAYEAMRSVAHAQLRKAEIGQDGLDWATTFVRASAVMPDASPYRHRALALADVVRLRIRQEAARPPHEVDAWNRTSALLVALATRRGSATLPDLCRILSMEAHPLARLCLELETRGHITVEGNGAERAATITQSGAALSAAALFGDPDDG